MANTADPDRAVRRSDIERKLAHYPNVDQESVDDMVRWFRKEASSLDVALLATNQDIAEAYRRFRADHIDGITLGDVLKGILFAVAIAAIVILIVWRAL